MIMGFLCVGLSYAQPGYQTFENLNIRELPKNDLAEVIYETRDGAIWVGFSNAGLYRYNGYSIIKLDPEVYGLDANSFNRIISICQQKNGDLLLGSRDNGVSLLNFEHKTASRINNAENGDIDHALSRVWSFHEDSDGIIWMASWGGLIQYNPDNSTYELFRFSFKSLRNDRMNPSIFRSVQPDSDDPDILWITGITGLFSFDKSLNVFTHHRHPESMYKDGHRNFEKEHLQYLMTDLDVSGDDLFMSSWGGGILHYNKQLDSWKNYLFTGYSTTKTLDENICNQISRLDDKLVFAAVTGSGILDISTGEIRNFSDPMNSQFSSGYALLEDKGGKLWVSTYGNGIYVGTPDHLYKNKIDSLAFEISLIRLGGELLWKTSEKTIPNIFTIPADKDSLYMEFALINPFDPADVEYQYKIAGYTKDWISNGRQNYILLSKLPKGNHQLFFRAREDQDKWSYSSPLTIEREVSIFREPFFWLGIALAVIGVFAFWIRRRVKRTIEKGKTERKLAELKMQALQAQMNPHFIFNALNSINTYILKQEPEKASDFLDLFSKLIRKILNNSSKPMISLSTDIDIIRSYIDIEQIRFNGKFDYSIQVSDDIDQSKCLVPPLIIQPYVENAIWHGLMQLGKRGSLLINYSRHTDQLQIEVIDDGIGRKKSKSTRSSFKKDKPVGMDLAGNRVDVFQKMFGDQAEIIIADKNPELENTGTIVRVKIPYILQKSSTLGSD
jgi:hypothetical protein